MKFTTLSLFFVCISILFPTKNNQASQIPEFPNQTNFHNDGFIHLGNFADIAKDTNEDWRFININLGKYDSAFTAIGGPIRTIDFTTGTYWMRSHFVNNSEETQFFLECARPITNVVELYVMNSSGELIQMEKSRE